MRMLALLLSQPPLARGFVFMSDAVYRPLYSYVWDTPLWDFNTTSRGFGAGLAYAVRPSFCDRMLPHFQEGSAWVNCKLLRAAINRAFHTWSDNHPTVNFLDVTSQCNMSAPDLHADCGAEVIVDAGFAGSTETPTGEAAAYVLANVQQGLLRSPSGTVRTTYPTQDAEIVFSTETCWYLDSTFCSKFHRHEQSTNQNVRLMATLIIFLVWAVALIGIIVTLAHLSHDQVQTSQRTRKENLMRKAKRLHRTMTQRRRLSVTHIAGKEWWLRQWHALMTLLQKLSVKWMFLGLVSCTAPISIYVHILQPCWDCFDFESAAVHEVGHLLGLAHPDTLASWQRTALVPMGAESCMQPLDHLVWTEDLTDVEPHDPASVMLAFTQHPKEVCLSADDLEGLNYLYPVCSGAVRTDEISCFKSERNIGWARLAMWVFLPVMCLMLLLICIIDIIKRHQNQRLGSFANKFHQLKQYNGELLDAIKERSCARRDADVQHLAAVQSLEQELHRVTAKLGELAHKTDHHARQEQSQALGSARFNLASLGFSQVAGSTRNIFGSKSGGLFSSKSGGLYAKGRDVSGSKSGGLHAKGTAVSGSQSGGLHAKGTAVSGSKSGGLLATARFVITTPDMGNCKSDGNPEPLHQVGEQNLPDALSTIESSRCSCDARSLGAASAGGPGGADGEASAVDVLVTSTTSVEASVPPPPTPPPPTPPLPTPPPPGQPASKRGSARPSMPKNWKQVKKKGSVYYYNTVTMQTTMDINDLPPPLPKNWEEAVDKKSGTVYYWNKKTRETRASPPISEEEAVCVTFASSGRSPTTASLIRPPPGLIREA